MSDAPKELRGYRAHFVFRGSSASRPLRLNMPKSAGDQHTDSVEVEGKWSTWDGRFEVANGCVELIAEVLERQHSPQPALNRVLEQALRRGAVGRVVGRSQGRWPNYEWKKLDPEVDRWSVFLEITCRNDAKVSYGVDRFHARPGKDERAIVDLNLNVHDAEMFVRKASEVTARASGLLSLMSGRQIEVEGDLHQPGQMFAVRKASAPLKDLGPPRDVQLSRAQTPRTVFRVVRPPPSLQAQKYEAILLFGR